MGFVRCSQDGDTCASVYIYGAGTYGRLTKKILDSQNVSILSFVDRKLAGTSVDGVGVISPEELPEANDRIIYIAVKNFFGEIRDYLQGKRCRNIRDIKEVLNIPEKELPATLSEHEKDVWIHRRTYEIAVEMADMQGAKLNHVEMVMTQKCTLRCKGCSSLMPYYDNPKNISVENQINWLNNLLVAVAYVGEVRILGGEPFLNRDLGKLIDALCANKKIGMITIYSNGMVMPDLELMQSLAAKAIPVHISDYGVGGEQRQCVLSALRDAGVSVYARKYDSWYDMGKVQPNGLKNNQVISMFRNCKVASCNTILDGKLYQCPRAAHADVLGIVKCDEKEVVNLSSPLTCLEKERLGRIQKKELPTKACFYCMGTEAGTIPAAVQVAFGSTDY